MSPYRPLNRTVIVEDLVPVWWGGGRFTTKFARFNTPLTFMDGWSNSRGVLVRRPTRVVAVDPAMISVGITGSDQLRVAHLIRTLPELGPFRLRSLTHTFDVCVLAARLIMHVERGQGDLGMPGDCTEFVRGLDVIMNLAHAILSLTLDRQPPSDVQATLLPTLNLIEAIRTLKPSGSYGTDKHQHLLHGAGPRVRFASDEVGTRNRAVPSG